MASDSKLVSFEEAAKHNRKSDCWLIISGKVYDVTRFLDDHPGGDEVLLLATEKDATQDFEFVGHSQNARDMLKDYYVGEIDSSTITQKNQYKPPSNMASASNQAPGSSSNQILILRWNSKQVLNVTLAGSSFTPYQKEVQDESRSLAVKLPLKSNQNRSRKVEKGVERSVGRRPFLKRLSQLYRRARGFLDLRKTNRTYITSSLDNSLW